MTSQKNKFDRQIRIWGAHGQSELQSAAICLLHAGPSGSETLKNLVLGGIAAFTIVDDAEASLKQARRSLSTALSRARKVNSGLAPSFRCKRQT